MKKEKYLRLLPLLLLCLLFRPHLVFASENTYDITRKGSITVQLDELGTNKEGVVLSGYRVVVPKYEEDSLTGWQMEDTYSSLDLDFRNLEDAEAHRKAAEKLEKFIKDNKISPLMQGRTDKEGKCSFSNLEQGIYLICQENGFSQYGTIQSFLVPIPYLESDLLLYDVKTETKGAKPETPVAPPPSKPEEKPPAKTGDTAPVEGLLMLTAFPFICAGYLVLQGKKK